MSNGNPSKRKPGRWKRRAVMYGALCGMLYAAYAWQPVRIDLLPRRLPESNPPVDPDSKRLFASGVKIAVVVAHPDDSEYYLGPLLLKLAISGAELHQIVITNGDKGYYPWVDAKANAAVRQREQQRAAAAWKAKTMTFLNLRDGRLDDADAEPRIGEALRAIQPEYVLAFDGLYPPRASHGDHRSAGRASALAVAGAASVRWLLVFSTMAPNHVVEVSKQVGPALDLLALHKSQWTGEKLARIRRTVHANWIEAGERIGSDAGVQLRCVQVRQ